MTSGPLRKLANTGRLDFVDMHLSHVSQMIMEGFLGRIDFAIVEATEITPDGRVYLTTGIGNAPTFLQKAEQVIIELNAYHSPRIRELADIIVLPPPPAPASDPDPRPAGPDRQAVRRGRPGQGGRGRAHQRVRRRPRASRRPTRRAGGSPGTSRGSCSTRWRPGGSRPSSCPCRAASATSATPWSAGSPPSDGFPQFKVYTEVLQDAMLDLIATGSVIGASTCSLTLTDEKLKFLYDYFDEFADRIVLRPQEISNNPGIARRLGVIATNTAIEVDIYGHANSTHFFGTQIMNGLGGSGDFERNAYLSIFMCPSTAKGGRISTIVPMCSHVDHSEHSVQIIATEQGLADLRGLSPIARARRIIDRCAHPAYRDYLHHYLESAPMGHIRHDLQALLRAVHQLPGARRQMLPDLDLAQFDGDVRPAGRA